MSSLKDKYNFDLGYERGCKDTEAKWKQKLQDAIIELKNWDIEAHLRWSADDVTKGEIYGFTKTTVRGIIENNSWLKNWIQDRIKKFEKLME